MIVRAPTSNTILPKTIKRSFFLTVCLFFLLTGVANATNLYVGPGGASTGSDCTSQSHPCTFEYAVSLSFNGDTVNVDSGHYTIADTVVPNGVTVKGQAVNSTILTGQSTFSSPSLTLGNAAAIKDLQLIVPGIAGRGVSFAGGSSADRVDIRADDTACYINGNGINITNSICDNTNVALTAPALSGGPGNAAGTVTLRNDTIIGQTRGIDFETSDHNVPQDLDLVNTIVLIRDNSPSNCDIFLQAPFTNGSLNLHSTNSYHNDVVPGNSCIHGVSPRLTASQTNRQTDAPAFVNNVASATTADFREASESPSRGAGVTDDANGTYDITASSPRSILGATDIGAYQFIQAPDQTLNAPVLGSTTATLHASVNNHGLNSSSSFEYGIDAVNENFPDAINLLPLADEQNVALDLTGLIPNTTYKYDFCSVVLNFTPCVGQSTFTTLPLAPVISSSGVVNTSTVLANVTAVVNPGNDVTTVHFEYGTNTSFGTSTANEVVAKSLSNSTVASAVTGLTPDTTYYVRAVATNGAGTVVGTPFTVRTASSPPVTPVTAFSLVGKPTVKKGTVTFRAKTSSAGKIVARATVKVNGKTKTYASKTLTVTKSGTATVKMTTSKTGKKAYKKYKHLKANLSATFTPTTGAKKTITAKVKLK